MLIYLAGRMTDRFLDWLESLVLTGLWDRAQPIWTMVAGWF